MALTRRPRTPALALLLAAPHFLLPARAFYFQWSSTSYQCYTQTLSWVGGTPPFRAVIAPILQMPFVYDIPASAYVDGKGQYDITVQLTSGLSYVIMMGDASGMGTGGSSGRITVQGYAESGCLADAAKNQTTLDLSFMVSATNIQQCRTSYNLTWDLTTPAIAPYNMTVISLDQSFNPFDVPFGNTTAFDWQVSVAAGKSFTVMMNDGKGYGYGGVGNAYTVNRTGGLGDCVFVGGSTTTSSASATTTGTSHSTTSVRATSITPTTTSTGVGSGTGSGDGPPKGTVIAGASIGALVGIGLSAAVAFLCFFYRRRRRRRQENARIDPDEEYDDDGGSAGMGKGSTRSKKRRNVGGGGSVVMVDGRRRPADAMSVNLFDDSEGYHDPNDGHYIPIPYDFGGGASSYSGSPVTPASNTMAPPPVVAGNTRNGMNNGDSSPITPTTTTAGMPSGGDNPFEWGRELHGEEANAALALSGVPGGGRPWSGGSGTTDTLQSRRRMSGGAHGAAVIAEGDGRGSLHRLETFTDSRSTASSTMTASGGGGGDASGVPSSRTDLRRTKSEEAMAQVDAVAGEGRERHQQSAVYSGDSPAASPHFVSPPSTGGGGFRITNATDSDPFLPRAPHTLGDGRSGIMSNTTSHPHPRRQRGEPRFVRHADAGRAVQQEEVIDLPPLYTDLVPLEDPPQPPSAGRE